MLSFAPLAEPSVMLARPVGRPRLALYPLPVQGHPVARSVDDELLADRLCDGFLYLQTGGMGRESFVGVRYVSVDNHAAFKSDGFKNEGFSPTLASVFVPPWSQPSSSMKRERRSKFSRCLLILSLSRLVGIGNCSGRLSAFIVVSAIPLQTSHVGQGGHLLVQRQNFQAGAGIVVGNEAVEQSRAAGRRQGLDDGSSVQWSDQPAA